MRIKNYQIQQMTTNPLTKLKLIFLWAFVISVMPSCNNITTNKAYSPEAKKEADSLTRNVKNIDSLKNIYNNYLIDENREGQMMALKHLGKLQREANEFGEAIDTHTKGYNIAIELCDTPEIIYALNNIGTNYRRMSMLEDAATFHYRALQFCEDYSDKETYDAKKNRVVSLNGIGNISLRLSDYETADSIFRVALAGERELGSALGQAINYANLGSIYEHHNQLDSALIYYHRSMEMNIQAKSNLGISLCHGYFGGIHEKNGLIDSAIVEYQKAFDMKGKIDDWHWLNSCLSLAQLYLKQGNTILAQQLLSQAEGVANKSRSRDHSADIYSLLSGIYEKQGNMSKALDYHKKSQAYNDSIVSEKNLIQIQNERVQYEYRRRQHEINTLQSNYDAEKRLNNIIKLSMIAIAILSIIIVVLLLHMLKMKKKRHQALQHLDDVRTSFFTNITHEFRTPLTVIIGIGEQLINMPNAENVSKLGDMIARQGKNLLLLINQILDVSKMKSVTTAQEYKHGDIVGYIHTVVECTRQLAQRKNISLLFSHANPQINMDFVPDYINKVITNLVANAIKFTPENGRIYITADVEKDNLRLCVADNGCGIAREDIPHIFDVFYQASTVESGTGVGLALVRQLIEAMNGNITIKSAKNEGSVFIITLPIKQGNNEWDALTDTTIEKELLLDNGESAPIESDEIFDDKPIILVVDDNNDILSYIGSVIKNAHIHYAYDGESGFSKALEIVPDIIITDIMMPGIDGLEMTRKIRESEILNHIPIIAVTAKSSEKDKLEGIKAGVNSYIYKPFNADELNATIANVLDHRRHIQENFARNNPGEILEAENSQNNNDQIFLNKVIDIIYTQMSQQNVNPAEIASALCLCTKQLSRKINAITGESLGKYILHVRMNRAKKLFDSDNGYSVADVAHRCGYDENSNFTRAFKQVFGITPSQYNKRPQ